MTRSLHACLQLYCLTLDKSPATMNADLHLESASVALTPGGGGDAGGPLAEEACPASPPAAPSGSSGAGGFSYDEVFPALPEKEAVPEVSSSSGSLGQWNHRMHVKSSVITQVGGGARRGVLNRQAPSS